jgi:hypothetical protein
MMLELVQTASWDRGQYEGEWLIRRHNRTQNETLFWTLYVSDADGQAAHWAVHSQQGHQRDVVYASGAGPWQGRDVQLELDGEAQQVLAQLRDEGWVLAHVRNDHVRGVIYGVKRVYTLRYQGDGGVSDL